MLTSAELGDSVQQLWNRGGFVLVFLKCGSVLILLTLSASSFFFFFLFFFCFFFVKLKIQALVAGD